MSDSLLELTPSFTSQPIKIKALANQVITIRHELTRLPAGWLVIDTNRKCNVWRTGITTDTLELISDQDAEITILLL